MFNINRYFESYDIFNDILVKRFEDNFHPEESSRLWVTPGHIVFTTDNFKLHTCDARPYDFSTSPSEAETDELLTTPSSVLEIFFDTGCSSTRMFVVLTNGDVQIFEYRTLLYEWARIGYFNVNIVSPNTNNNHIIVTQVLISQHQNMIYWSQKSGNSDTCFDLHKREIPLNGVREITQSAIGVPQRLLKNCPKFDLIEIRDSVCIIPHLPNLVNFYIILSARLHTWLFHIDGKLLWRGVIGDNPLDFISICTKTIGLWSQNGCLKVCKLLDNVKSYASILNNEVLISIAPNGEIRSRVHLDVNVEEVQNCFIIQNIIFIFLKNYQCLQVFSTHKGQLLQSFDLTVFSPINGVWYHSCIPSVGFYSNHQVYKLTYKSLSTLLTSEEPCLLETSNLVKNDHYHVYSLLRDVMYHKFETCDIPPLKSMPKILQSEALLLAILQSCREKGFDSKDFPVKNLKNILFPNGVDLPDTKMKELLSPIVECFQKLEKTRISLLKNP